MAWLKVHDRLLPLDKESFSIGRSAEEDLVLPESSVSRKHARIYRQDELPLLEDLNSLLGTFVNGVRIQTARLKDGDQITIGPFHLFFLQSHQENKPPVSGETFGRIQSGLHDVSVFKKRLHTRLLERMDIKKISLEENGGEERLRNKTRDLIQTLLGEEEKTPAGIPLESFIEEFLNETLGLGPIEPLLSDPAVTEVMVNGSRQIYVEKGGKLHLTGKRFMGDEQVRTAIERIVHPLGRRIDESSPMVDARLKDGSRVNAVIPPLSLNGPLLTIRKFPAKRLILDDMIRFGSLDLSMARFLGFCVASGKNILISGGTGSGKTTLLNLLSSSIPEDERIVTIEDAAELRLNQPHVISLETRPANLEGKGLITIRDLVRNSLRMRPDRIVVGECRGAEALDMLMAMNTGHDGSLTTIHANTPRDALSRLETLVLMAGMDLPSRAIRQQMASAVHIIIQQSRMADGTRKITHITELTGIDGEVFTLQDIFRFQKTGNDASGKVIGRFEATGIVPVFCDRLRKEGVKVPLELFHT